MEVVIYRLQVTCTPSLFLKPLVHNIGPIAWTDWERTEGSAGQRPWKDDECTPDICVWKRFARRIFHVSSSLMPTLLQKYFAEPLTGYPLAPFPYTSVLQCTSSFTLQSPTIQRLD
ncbi:uncharacterized protein ACNLHF_003270 isoform 2-T2 [Anomaloglossus baeobatrachus]